MSQWGNAGRRARRKNGGLLKLPFGAKSCSWPVNERIAPGREMLPRAAGVL